MSKQGESLQPGRARRRGDRLVGTSRAMQAVVEQIAVAGRGRFPVWIYGEDGVDKELIARLIHDASEWTSSRFFSLDVSAVPRGLLRREIFGAEEGAVPSLPEAYEGALGRTEGGTVFIDRIEALPKDIQLTLAAELEHGSYRRLGAREDIPLESRLIAASSSSLQVTTDEGRLVPELSERLRLLEIEVPPLRERPEDVVPIAAHTLSIERAELEEETGTECAVRGFSAGTLERLVGYEWPGNESELRQQIRAALRIAGTDELEPGDLMLGWNSAEGVPTFREAKRAFEREYVTRVLRMCGGNISKAARIADKDRKDFYDVMRRNAIKPAEFRT